MHRAHLFKRASTISVGEATAPKVQMISATTVEDDHHSRLSLLDHDTDSDMRSELDDEPSSLTNPIVFSEDPMTCSNEMLEFAKDLVDVAVTKIAESVEIMDASHIQDFSRWKERLDRTSKMMEIVDTDTPTVRLSKARTYLMDAGELLKRVIIVVENAKTVNDVGEGHWNSTRLAIFESAEWHV